MSQLKIEAIAITPLRVPFQKTIGSSLARYEWIECVGVEVKTDQGLTGFGFTVCLGGSANSAIAPYIRDELAPLAIGQDALAPEALWHRMWAPNKARLRAGIGMWALSAIDIAIWDLVGKAANLPLHTLFGGYERNVPIYGTGGWLTMSPDELVIECNEFLVKGISGYKIKIGTPDDEKRIAYLRNAVGSEVAIFTDANQGYLPAEAIEVSKMLREYDIAWLEEPIIANTVDDLAEVAAKSAVPVAAGENVYARWGFRELCERRAASFLQPDVGRCGGITEFRKIAHLAEAFNLRLSSHLCHELSISLVGASSSAYRVEYAELLPADLWSRPFEVRNGKIAVPQVPGHGVEFSPIAVDKYRAN